MNSIAKPAAERTSLDDILGTIKQSHKISGCKNCGMLSLFPKAPRQPASSTR